MQKSLRWSYTCRKTLPKCICYYDFNWNTERYLNILKFFCKLVIYSLNLIFIWIFFHLLWLRIKLCFCSERRNILCQNTGAPSTTTVFFFFEIIHYILIVENALMNFLSKYWEWNDLQINSSANICRKWNYFFIIFLK